MVGFGGRRPRKSEPHVPLVRHCSHALRSMRGPPPRLAQSELREPQPAADTPTAPRRRRAPGATPAPSGLKRPRSVPGPSQRASGTPGRGSGAPAQPLSGRCVRNSRTSCSRHMRRSSPAALPHGSGRRPTHPQQAAPRASAARMACAAGSDRAASFHACGTGRRWESRRPLAVRRRQRWQLQPAGPHTCRRHASMRRCKSHPVPQRAGRHARNAPRPGPGPRPPTPPCRRATSWQAPDGLDGNTKGRAHDRLQALATSLSHRQARPCRSHAKAGCGVASHGQHPQPAAIAHVQQTASPAVLSARGQPACRQRSCAAAAAQLVNPSRKAAITGGPAHGGPVWGRGWPPGAPGKEN